ncbi:hypothetical protein QYM36_012933 [Artemia franciscana]|uniref:Uncharacterized protein n=1 Tax=Artemia franciscana TaxID=6661 RepID=A0AA88L5V7_ARTSF|nr:hypothetical protein QYM36_012933 [Artemia franciscana]
MAEYRCLNCTHNKVLHRDRKTFVDMKSSNLEDAARRRDPYLLYKYLHKLMEGKPFTVSCVLFADGSMLDNSSQFSEFLIAKAVPYPDPHLIQAAMGTPKMAFNFVFKPFTASEYFC